LEFPLNLPTVLTLSRIALCPLFLAFYLYPGTFGLNGVVQPALLLLLATFMLATDALDGYLARKWKIVTKIGKLLDPMSDCIVFLSIFFALTRAPLDLPLWIPITMMCREISVVYLRSLLALQQEAMGARWTGKLKTIYQSFALYAVLAGLFFYGTGWIDLPFLQTGSLLIMSLAAFLSVLSLLEYGVHCKETLKKSFKNISQDEIYP
jgi:CDP-diacylglycerol--glycerol-3-phosphate 3-phosphatidyltransferase